MSPAPNNKRQDRGDWPEPVNDVDAEEEGEVNSKTVREGHKVNESSFLVESGEDLAKSREDEIQKHGELGLRGGCDWDH